MEAKGSTGLRRELGVRLYLTGITALCFVGTSLFYLAVGLLSTSGWVVLAVATGVLWVLVSLPWLAMSLLVAGDFFFFAATGKTFFVPLMIRWGRLEEEHRRLANRPSMIEEVGRATKVVREIAFYTNPLSPLVIAVSIYLMGKPALDSVEEAVHQLNRHRTTHAFVTDVSLDLSHRTGASGRGVAA